jgi:hypothetical protein
VSKLDGARIKLGRAGQHIAELSTAAQQFLGTNPFYLQTDEAENGDLVTIVRIRSQVPADWAAIVGDAVHNMRSALDLVAWQLVEAAGAKPGRDTCFPIGHASKAQSVAAIKRSLGEATKRAAKLTRRLKPYQGGNAKLAQLHALDIVDKHRLVLVVGAATKHVVLKMRMTVPWQEAAIEFPPLALNPADRQFPLRDGEEVFRVCKAARQPSGPNACTHDLVFELAFGDITEVRGLPLVDTLKGMHAHVSRIVEMFDKIVA